MRMYCGLKYISRYVVDLNVSRTPSAKNYFRNGVSSLCVYASFSVFKSCVRHARISVSDVYEHSSSKSRDPLQGAQTHNSYLLSIKALTDLIKF
jgi:hypothetical protein